MTKSRADDVLAEWHSVSGRAARPPLAAISGRQLPVGAALTRLLPAALVVVLVIGGALYWHSLNTQSAAGPANSQWGPLAVVHDASGDKARASGTLVITQRCSFLRGTDQTLSLLVWPANATTWDSGRRQIWFAIGGSDALTLTDGDRIWVSGGGSSVNEDNLDPKAFLARTDWVSKPATDCLTDTRWFVGIVGLN